MGRPVPQHATVATDGTIWTGRHWDTPPGCSPATRGSFEAGPFLLDLQGEPGAGPDRLEGPQRDAALQAVALIQDVFDLPLHALNFHGMTGQGWPPSGTSCAEIENAVRALRGTRRARPRRGTKDAALAAAQEWLKGPADMNENDREADDGPGRDPGEPPAGPNGSARAAHLDPGTLAGLRPHVIDLWGGRFSSGGIFKTDDGDIDRIFNEDLPRRIAALPRDKTLPVVVYAHGGLVGEEAGLQIAANQVPWWNANGCYPLQFIWETGFFEEIQRLLGTQRAAARGFSDVTDAVVETAVRAGGGPRIWGGMKDAAAAAFATGAAGAKVADRLAVLARNPKVRLHAVGHSAGCIFNAHLLARFDALDVPALESLTFMAPAITVADYERLADPLIPRRAKRVRIFTMTKDFERADTVTWAYRKSLLYLIHNALEPRRGEPILGLEESLRADPRLVKRFGLGGGPADTTGTVVWSQTPATTGSRASRATTHGGFDNDVPTMESVARDILGIPDAAPLPRPFPPDTEARAAVRPRPHAPHAPIPEKPMPSPPAVGNGVRKALCIGIDAYPNPANQLHGCVADATDWEAALVRLGFTVDALHNEAATRDAILRRLSTLVDASRSGDVLVWQYSGHGTHVPDLDGDEVSGEDQAICPVDFEDGQLLIDDDIRAVLDRLPAGVQLTCFMDNCYSYSNTRVAVGKAAAPDADSRARFVVLTPAVEERYRSLRDAGTRAAAPLRRAGTPEEMTWVAFAACNSDEVAYETRGRGDFSRLAVPLLSAGLTNRQFRDRVTDGLGAQPRQHPKLDCRRESGDAPVLAFAAGKRAAVPEPLPVPATVDRTAAAADLFDALSRLLR